MRKPTGDKSVLNSLVSACARNEVANEGAGPTGPDVQLLTPRGPKSGRRFVGPAAAGVCLVLLATACASFSCRPLSITVAEKEERARLDTVPRGITSETGRLEVKRAPEIIRDYWVRAEDGTWYRVPLDRFRTAEVGRPLEICR